MKSITFNLKTFFLVASSFMLLNCSKDDSSENSTSEVISNEYYIDETGKYTLELGEEGFNIYEGDKLYNPDGKNLRSAKEIVTLANTTDIRKEQYGYSGLCQLPPDRRKVNLDNLPNKPAKPGKKNITNNFKSIGKYSCTPRPQFLGGSKYSCYECTVSDISRDEYYLGACNGNLFISGSLSDDPSMQSVKSLFSTINFTPSETDAFIKQITSTGLYNCSKK